MVKAAVLVNHKNRKAVNKVTTSSPLHLTSPMTTRFTHTKARTRGLLSGSTNEMRVPENLTILRWIPLNTCALTTVYSSSNIYRNNRVIPGQQVIHVTSIPFKFQLFLSKSLL